MKKCCNILLLLTMGWFVLSSVNVVFALHMQYNDQDCGQEHREHHCPDDCSVCQNLFRKTDTAYIQADPEIIITQRSFSETFVSDIDIIRNIFEPFMARPPPQSPAL